MAIFKCKMCGGDLEIKENDSVCTCIYCGTEQTLPRLDSERKANLYDRANHFRRNNDYDKAMSIYEQILNEDNTDAEAYWSLVLCNYGIEYVEDPSSHKRIPTINRAQYTSIYADENYKSAIEYAGIAQKSVYEQEAKNIDEIQKGILAISSKEEPFDVFICYKESDENGRRTPDSVLANDLYHQLKQEGFKVFFARITLEDKLGQEYEPYIFAALNSAKVMVVLGTKPEYFKAVWVKNEWSRYLSLIRSGAKKMLIPAYKDMDPYDLPEEFSHLQAQDMTKLGFMQDLIRGIKKIIGAEDDKKSVQETVLVQQSVTNSNIVALLKRGNMALEDREWPKADGFFEEVLNQDAENPHAYLGKLLSKYRASSIDLLTEYFATKYDSASSEVLTACEEDENRIQDAVSKYYIEDYLDKKTIEDCYEFDRNYSSEVSSWIKNKEQISAELQQEKTLSRVKQYATEEIKNKIDKMLDEISAQYNARVQKAKEEDEKNIATIQREYALHLNHADEKAEELFREAIEEKEEDYQDNIEFMSKANSVKDLELVRGCFECLNGYKESSEYAKECMNKIQQLEDEQRAAVLRAEKKKRIKIVCLLSGLLFSIAGFVIYFVYLGPLVIYKKAIQLRNAGQYEEAIAEFEKLGTYKYSVDQFKDSQVQVDETKYQRGLSYIEEKRYAEALEEFKWLADYKDSNERRESLKKEISYQEGLAYLNAKKYGEARDKFIFLGDYKDSAELAIKSIKLLYAGASMGDTIYFGDKGSHAWIVIGKEEDRILLLSRDCITRKGYTTINGPVTWEQSSIREWLNGEYYNRFTEIEKKLICQSNVKNDDNKTYGTTGGNITSDNIFLLSIEEVNKLPLNLKMAKSQSGESCIWWLRSPGDRNYKVACVNDAGYLDAEGKDADLSGYAAVRPAMWVDILNP